MTGHPPIVVRPGAVDFATAARLAQVADEALLDAVLLDDRGTLEPTTLAGALTAATRHVGVVVTVSTTHQEPYHLARALATVDYAGGRSGWYPVVSAPEEAANFGGAREVGNLSDEERMARAEEFFDVVTGLWDSFDDDAFPRDRAAGVYLDIDKLHRLDHVGPHFSVAGPLNIARPPQGRPVTFARAGGPVAGRADVLLVDHHDLASVEKGTTPVFAEVSTAFCLDLLADGLAADGVVLVLPDVPGAAEDFAHRVVPGLRELGLLREFPGGATLRDRLGLSRPESRYATGTSGR